MGLTVQEAGRARGYAVVTFDFLYPEDLGRPCEQSALNKASSPAGPSQLTGRYETIMIVSYLPVSCYTLSCMTMSNMILMSNHAKVNNWAITIIIDNDNS